MKNRIHVKDPNSAEKIVRFLKRRGERLSTLRNGCIYDDGLIIELGDNALVVACDLADAFGIEMCLES